MRKLQKKAYAVLSIGQLRGMLAKAEADFEKRSQIYRSSAPKELHCVTFREIEIIDEKYQYQISSFDFANAKL